MKLKNLLGILFAVAIFSVAASAQLPSLANVGDDLFTSEEDGFEIAVPDGCMAMTQATTVRTYRCDLVEGLILITVEERAKAITSDEGIRAYTQGVKEGFENSAKTKLSESPAKIGEYKGYSFTGKMGEDKVILISLLWEKMVVTILGRANATVPNSDAKILKAVSSFAFNSDDK
ncbi:MAG TPA: hypothetical protein PKA82_16175 [Pyrinomonadaceae bacterium]|nr:hypothetical protein [Pyrinomonadaceae bacterium]